MSGRAPASRGNGQSPSKSSVVDTVTSQLVGATRQPHELILRPTDSLEKGQPFYGCTKESDIDAHHRGSERMASSVVVAQVPRPAGVNPKNETVVLATL